MTQAAVLASNASLMTTPSGTAPGYMARAWVNFNGTGTVAIRASGNVSSITDNGTGDYTVNFTTAMPDANYVVIAASAANSSAVSIGHFAIESSGGLGGAATLKTTTQVNVRSNAVSGTSTYSSIDPSEANVAIFR
jgi:hypothetical protein